MILGYHYFRKHPQMHYNVQCMERWEHESRHEIFHVCFWVSALTCTCQMFDVTTVIILCEWEIQGFNVVFVSSPIEMFFFFKDKLLASNYLGCQKHPYSHNIHRHTHICAAWIQHDLSVRINDYNQYDKHIKYYMSTQMSIVFSYIQVLNKHTYKKSTYIYIYSYLKWYHKGERFHPTKKHS